MKRARPIALTAFLRRCPLPIAIACVANQPLVSFRGIVSASLTGTIAASDNEAAAVASRVAARICHRAGADGGMAAGSRSHVLRERGL